MAARVAFTLALHRIDQGLIGRKQHAPSSGSSCQRAGSLQLPQLSLVMRCGSREPGNALGDAFSLANRPRAVWSGRQSTIDPSTRPIAAGSRRSLNRRLIVEPARSLAANALRPRGRGTVVARSRHGDFFRKGQTSRKAGTQSYRSAVTGGWLSYRRREKPVGPRSRCGLASGLCSFSAEQLLKREFHGSTVTTSSPHLCVCAGRLHQHGSRVPSQPRATRVRAS